MADGKDLVLVDNKELALLDKQAEARDRDRKSVWRGDLSVYAALAGIPVAAGVIGAVALGPIGLLFSIPGIVPAIGAACLSWRMIGGAAGGRIDKAEAEEKAEAERVKTAEEKTRTETKEAALEKIRTTDAYIRHLDQAVSESLAQAIKTGAQLEAGTELPVCVANESPRILSLTKVTDESVFGKDGQFVQVLSLHATLYETNLQEDGCRVKGEAIAGLAREIPWAPERGDVRLAPSAARPPALG